MRVLKEGVIRLGRLSSTKFHSIHYFHIHLDARRSSQRNRMFRLNPIICSRNKQDMIIVIVSGACLNLGAVFLLMIVNVASNFLPMSASTSRRMLY